MKHAVKMILVAALSLFAIQAWAGPTGGNDSNGNSPGDSSDGCGCGSSKGMPVYSFKSMLAGLSIRDTPVGYTPPVGPKVETTITYNEREADQPATFDSYNVGQKWTLNWLSYIQDNPATPGSQVLRYVAGGGGEPYSGYNASTGAFKAEENNAAVLVRTSGSPITYELRFADGSKDVFSASDGKTTYPRKVFLTQIVDPQGNALALSYDGQLRLTSVTDAIGQATTFQYGNSNNPLLVTGITDPFGRSATLGYDSSGRLDSITDVIGMQSAFAYDSGTFVQSMTTPYGTTSFAHTEGVGSSTELSVQATDPDGHTERTEYRHNAPGIAYSDPQAPTGMGVRNEYLNYRNSFYWDKDAYAAACTGSGTSVSCDYTRARIKHFLHNAANTNQTSRVLESVKYPLEGRVWYRYLNQSSSIYTGSLDKPTYVGRVLSDGTTQLTSYTYNAEGQVTKKIDPDGRETDYTYAPNGIDLVEVQQKDGSSFDVLAQYTYNSQHEPLTYTDAAGQTTTYTYNARGQRTSITDALGHTTSYAFDNNGYLTTITNALGHVQHSFTYDADGRVATDTDSEGYTRSYTYDALDRITQIAYPGNTSRTFTWDKLDLASVKDRQGNTTTFTYDAERNLVAVTDPLGHTTHYSYYANGKLQTLTDPNGNVTTWTRDLEGRVIAKAYTDGHGDTLSYDNSSRLASVTDALGQTKIFTYDRADLPTAINYQDAVNPTAAVSYSYDAYYPRLVSMTDGIGTTSFGYVPAGATGALKLASVNGPFSSNDTVGYVYDALGRVIERTTDQPDDFTYDPLGRLSGESNPLGTFGYTYLGDTDQPAKQSLTTPSNTAGYTLKVDYDGNTSDRQLKTLTYRGPLALVATRQLNFTHSAEHQVLTKTDFSGSTLLTRLNGYTYDNDYRLTAMSVDLLPADSYTYDDADNLTDYTSNTGNNLSATANSLNQLAVVNGTGWQYDADGNLINDGTFQYAWDADNRLISVTKISTGHVTSFKYDGLGRRLAIDEQDNGGTPTETRYLWCGDTLCGARDGSDSVTADYYSQGEVRNGTALYYVKDQVGSIVGVMGPKGASLGSTLYSAYGVVKLTSGTTADIGYAGMLYNTATGLYLTKYREYSPAVGRWLNRDPIGELGGINVYAYVVDDPTGLIDPNGEGAIQNFVQALGVAVGILNSPGPAGQVPQAPSAPVSQGQAIGRQLPNPSKSPEAPPESPNPPAGAGPGADGASGGAAAEEAAAEEFEGGTATGIGGGAIGIGVAAMLYPTPIGCGPGEQCSSAAAKSSSQSCPK